MNDTSPAPSLLAALTARKLIAQVSNSAEIAPLIADGKMTFYIGVDPTASSLHCGHLVPLYLLIALAKRGNRAIVVIGDGTARIGDPSGKNEMRALIDSDTIARNGDAVEKQVATILARAGVKARFVRNGEWLDRLNYIEFLCEIGSQFSVNRMLTSESVKRRLAEQQGLSFLEFNYMLLQAYDFLILHQRYGCTLQIGGDDQWGNIVAGIDLIRRIARSEAYALTTPLILTANGEKMGKSAAGSLFVDPKRTPAFDYYQYWRNIDDRDLYDALLRFTELTTDEITRLTADDADINGDGSEIIPSSVTLINMLGDCEEGFYNKRAADVEENIQEITLTYSNTLAMQESQAQLDSAATIWTGNSSHESPPSLLTNSPDAVATARSPSARSANS